MSAMEERILVLAAEIARETEEPSDLLKALCLAAEAAWRGRLRENVSEEECAEALCCAAALTAAGGRLLGRGDDGIASFTAGAVSIRSRESTGNAALAEALQEAAERIMEPYCRETEFHFQGVRG